MNLFLFAVACLIGGALLMLLRPWRAAPAGHDATARDINARVYRDQLAELDRDRAAGTLAPADHAQARAELMRRLLDDAGRSETLPASPRPAARRTPLVLAVALPLAATALYAWLGTPAALLMQPAPPQAAMANPHQAPPAAGADGDAAAVPPQVEQMVARLAARLEKNPDDPKGWTMLGHSYRVMNRHADAAAAYAKVPRDVLERDPALLSAYADTLATLADGNIEGRPLQMVRAALALDPGHAMSLSLAATAAYRRGDYAEAAAHWQRLLQQLPPDSDEARFLSKTLADIGAKPPAASPKPRP